MKRRRECTQGHVFFKSTACPTCPQCEMARKAKDGFMTQLAAPARRALEQSGWVTLAQLARHTEAEVAALHGMGPNALGKLRSTMAQAGLRFRQSHRRG